MAESDSAAVPKEKTESEHNDASVGNDQKESIDFAGSGDNSTEGNTTEGNDGYDLSRQNHRGQRGGSFSYRRGGRGQYRRGRGNRGGYNEHHRNQQEDPDEVVGDGAVGQWNGAERERGKGGEKRYSRGRGGRQRTKSEKSSLLDGKRDPLPGSHEQNFDDIEDYWDVVVSGYSADMTEEDLWDTFGERDVAAIVQQFTHDMKPYCHVYTTSREMTNELLRCNRDMFRGNMLYVAMSEDIIARGVSLMLKKKPMKPKFKKPMRSGARGDDQAEEQQEEQSPKEETAEEGVEC